MVEEPLKPEPRGLVCVYETTDSWHQSLYATMEMHRPVGVESSMRQSGRTGYDRNPGWPVRDVYYLDGDKQLAALHMLRRGTTSRRRAVWIRRDIVLDYTAFHKKRALLVVVCDRFSERPMKDHGIKETREAEHRGDRFKTWCAGKTIMAGLYIRELIMRADSRRILVVAPGSIISVNRLDPNYLRHT